MNAWRTALRIVLTAAALAAVSCVELSGQRISIRYDAERDELQFLILYDGIHDSKDRSDTEGRQQLPAFIQNGDVLLVDWPGHIKMEEMRARAGAEDEAPALRALFEAVVANLRSQPLGRYRDPDGRVGAAQLVVISKAKDFIRKANAAISEAILAAGGSEDWPLTHKRMRRPAREGRQWLSIDGHSLRFAFPAHPAEWARFKVEALKLLIEEQKTGGDSKDRHHPAFLPQLLTLTPLSLIESSEETVIRLGDPGKPSTYRLAIRDEYKANLEDALADLVPTDLDRELAERLLAGTEGAAPHPVIEWGPPEDRARALMAAAADKDEARRKAAIEKLQAFAEVWNRENGHPEAPFPSQSAIAYLDAWKAWYRKVLVFPVSEP